MSLLDFLRGLPAWAKQLPPHLRPSPVQIRRLEVLRQQVGASDTEFLLHLASHPETTRRVQRHFYLQIKQQAPDQAEREILKQVVISRLTAAVGHGSDLFDLATATDDSDLHARLDSIVAQHPDLESLIEAMVDDEQRREPPVQPAPGFEEAARRVTQILRET